MCRLGRSLWYLQGFHCALAYALCVSSGSTYIWWEPVWGRCILLTWGWEPVAYCFGFHFLVLIIVCVAFWFGPVLILSIYLPPVCSTHRRSTCRLVFRRDPGAWSVGIRLGSICACPILYDLDFLRLFYCLNFSRTAAMGMNGSQL